MNTVLQVRDLAFPRGSMRYDAQIVTEPGAYLFDPAHEALSAAPVAEGGRNAAWFVHGTFGDGVLRRYRRGGLMAKLSRDRYIWGGEEATRSFAEFDLLHFLYRHGLAVPRPLAAAYWRSAASYTAAILVQRIAGARTLAQSLEPDRHADVAAAIHAMHEQGVWHADLNAYNILFDDHDKVWLIDFDKSTVRPLLSEERRRANLLRLRRSLVKVAGEPGLVWWEGLSRAYDALAHARGHL